MLACSYTNAADATFSSVLRAATVVFFVLTDPFPVRRYRQDRAAWKSVRIMADVKRKTTVSRVSFADAGGTTAAITAALCCAGTPAIVGALAALGLAFLRRDSILWPVMLLSLAVALWGFWRGRSIHGNVLPFIVGAVGAVLLSLGVIVVHGPPAMLMIYSGAGLLVIATVFNIWLRSPVRAAQ
jgi:hypothetical protein